MLPVLLLPRQAVPGALWSCTALCAILAGAILLPLALCMEGKAQLGHLVASELLSWLGWPWKCQGGASSWQGRRGARFVC